MQIQISWLLQKPTDLDLHCLQRQNISGFSRTRVNNNIDWNGSHPHFIRDQPLTGLYGKCYCIHDLNEQELEKTCLLIWAPDKDSKSACADAQSDQSSLSAWRNCILCYLKCVKWRFWLDCASVQADLNLRWAHMSKSKVFLHCGSAEIVSTSPPPPPPPQTNHPNLDTPKGLYDAELKFCLEW